MDIILILVLLVFFISAVCWVAALIFEILKRMYKWYMAPARVQRRQERAAERQQRYEAWSERREEERRKRDEERRTREEERTAVRRLTRWYEDQKRQVERSIPAGEDREALLIVLWERYDELVKNSIKEMKP